MDPQKISILIEGATGKLGQHVTKHALQRDNLLVNILVRDPQKNKQLAEQVEKAGGRVIKADLGDAESLKDVTKGIHTVVSTLGSFEEKVAVKGQLDLLSDAVKNGVKRFVHSYYGINYANVTNQEEMFPIKRKEIVKEQVHKSGIQAIDISVGVFIETWFDFQSRGGYHYAGDINQKIDFISYDDAAKYIVAVVSRENLAGKFNFVAQEASTKEFTETYNKVRGTNIQPRSLGSIQDLEKTKNDQRNADGSVPFILGLEYLIYSGIGKFPGSSNADFPEVTPTPLEEVFRRNPDLILKSE